MSKLLPAVVHEIPKDVQKEILSDEQVVFAWNDITPLARNEWICFINSAKKKETRKGRIARLMSDLKLGKRRPCCWAGCIHR
jgi:uncharacterized protein YdeI (YjbR/CyaY-like superfamily)